MIRVVLVFVAFCALAFAQSCTEVVLEEQLILNVSRGGDFGQTENIDCCVWGGCVCEIRDGDCHVVEITSARFRIDQGNSGVPEFSFLYLENVQGDFELNFNTGLQMVTLPRLQTVAGDLSIQGAPALEKVELGLLESVGQSLKIYQNIRKLAEINMTSLRTVGEKLSLGDNTDSDAGIMTSLIFDNLEFVGDEVLFDRMVHVETISLRSLHTVAGPLRFIKQRGCSNFYAENVVSVQYLTIRDMHGVTHFNFPNLNETGSIAIQFNVNCVSVKFPALAATSGTIQNLGNPKMMEFDFPLLTTVGGRLEVEGRSTSDQIQMVPSFPELVSVTDRIEFRYMNASSFSLPKLRSLDDFWLIDCPSLESVVLPNVELGGIISRNNLLLQEIAFPDATQGQGLFLFQNNPVLTSVSFPNVAWLRTLNFTENPLLGEVDVRKAENCSAYFYFANNTNGLFNFRADSLKRVDVAADYLKLQDDVSYTMCYCDITWADASPSAPPSILVTPEGGCVLANGLENCVEPTTTATTTTSTTTTTTTTATTSTTTTATTTEEPTTTTADPGVYLVPDFYTIRFGTVNSSDLSVLADVDGAALELKEALEGNRDKSKLDVTFKWRKAAYAGATSVSVVVEGVCYDSSGVGERARLVFARPRTSFEYHCDGNVIDASVSVDPTRNARLRIRDLHRVRDQSSDDLSSFILKKAVLHVQYE